MRKGKMSGKEFLLLEATCPKDKYESEVNPGSWAVCLNFDHSKLHVCLSSKTESSESSGDSDVSHACR